MVSLLKSAHLILPSRPLALQDGVAGPGVNRTIGVGVTSERLQINSCCCSRHPQGLPSSPKKYDDGTGNIQQRRHRQYPAAAWRACAGICVYQWRKLASNFDPRRHGRCFPPQSTSPTSGCSPSFGLPGRSRAPPPALLPLEAHLAAQVVGSPRRNACVS